MNLILSYLIFKYSKSPTPCYYTTQAADSYSQAGFSCSSITSYNALHLTPSQYSEAFSHSLLFTFRSSSGPAHLPQCLKPPAHYPRCNLQFMISFDEDMIEVFLGLEIRVEGNGVVSGVASNCVVAFVVTGWDFFGVAVVVDVFWGLKAFSDWVD